MARRRNPKDLTAHNVAQVVEALVAHAAAQAPTAPAQAAGTALAVRETTLPAVVDGEPAEDRMSVKSGMRSTMHRNRTALYPWTIAAALAVAGHSAWLIGWGSDQTGVVAVAAVIVSAVAARKTLARLPKGWAPWAGAAWLTGLAWLILTVAYGPSYERAVWLIAGTVVFGLRWWARVRRPYPSSGADPRDIEPVVKSAAVVVVEPTMTRWEMQDRWDRYLAETGGPLAGARLENIRAIEHGLVGDIHLVPGKQARETVLQAMPRICTALDSYPEDTIVERHPSGPPSMLQLTMVTKPAVKEAVFFDQPVYDNGRILLGPYRDGIGNAQIRLYGPDSMYNGFILGSPGSGKSRVLETIALSAITQHNTVLVYLDGQRGASSPLLWKHAMWRGGPEDTGEIMAGLSGFMRYRQLRLRYEGMKTGTVGFTPSRRYPASGRAA